MRAVFLSDLHLGHPRHEAERFARLAGLLEREPPDLLVLVGDIYEMWTRETAGLLYDRSVLAFASLVHRLREAGARVVAVEGNHD